MGKTASIYIDGIISSDCYNNSAAAIRNQLEYSGQFDEIQVSINSEGGDIAEGLAIYDMLGQFEKPVKTVVVGQCCSAATVVFLRGVSRLIFENVVAFMVHQATADFYGTLTASDAHLIGDLIDGYNKRIAAIYKERTGASDETIAEWLSKDSFMSAEQALANGFATAVSKPIQARYTLPTLPKPAPVEETAPAAVPPVMSTNPLLDHTMKIFNTQLGRIMASFNARAKNPNVKAQKVTTDAGADIFIEQAGESFAEGEPVNDAEGKPLTDGTHTIKGVVITVKEGKIETINTEGATAEVTIIDEPKTEEPATPETPETPETPADDTAAQLAAVQQENSDLKVQVNALNTNYLTVMAQMKVMLGNQSSAEPAIPAGPGRQVKVTNKATTTKAEDSRQDMLDEKEARGMGITVEELRAKRA